MAEEEVEFRTIFVESPSGQRFAADIPCDTPLSKVAADFFESQAWPTQDRRGRGQRAVVELVNPDDPDDTKRLNGDLDICEAGIQDGDILRIFPESIAGAVDQRARQNALIADHNEIEALVRRNRQIEFEANRSHAPDRYVVTFHYESFVELLPGNPEPRRSDIHRAEIILSGDYPRRAPIVRWQTPIFHPNIRWPGGAVCLGVLGERYLPGVGLGRLVTMLAEMVQWRNFDAFNAFNREAAEWAVNPEHWEYIQAIGGHPFQGPIEQLVKEFRQAGLAEITFKPLSPGGASQQGGEYGGNPPESLQAYPDSPQSGTPPSSGQ